MKYLVKARDYQNEALMANRLARADGTTKVTNVLASGLGKTLLAAFDIREYLSESKLARPRILILNGNIQLLKQIEHEFREKAFGHEYSYGVFNGAEKTSHITDFLFATFDSMYAHLDEFNADEFAYVFIDEAHHAQAMTYSKVIQHFRPERMLAVTATPLRMDGKDITELCGPIVYSLELEEAIARGLTAGVDYHLCLDEIEKIQLYLESGEPVSWNKLNSEIFVPKRDEEIITTVQRGVADLKDPTTIYFCRSIRHANRIAKLLPDSTVVHSHLSEKEVARRLKKFRCGEAKTIVAVDMLNEGIDIPRTDVVVFLRSTRSWTVFLQQLGRGLRLTEGKGAVRVYDFVGTATALEKVITLEKRVNDCARENGIEEKPNFELKINAVKFHISKVDIVQLLGRIRIQTYNTSFSNWDDLTEDEIWNDLIRLFQKFRDETGRSAGKEDLGKDYLPSLWLIKKYLGADLTLADIKERAHPDERINWTKEKFDQAVLDMYAECGSRPRNGFRRKYAKTHKNRCPSEETRKRFYPGGWEEAFDALGLPDDDIGKFTKKYSRSTVVEYMQLAVEEYGCVPTLDWYTKEFVPNHLGAPGVDTIRNASSSGKWSEVFFELGVVERGGELDRRVTAEKAINILREADAKVDGYLSLKKYKEYTKSRDGGRLPGQFTLSMALLGNMNGTWNEIKAAAGIEVRKRFGGPVKKSK
ncbi:DEAD/DEAH box helicase family protein [Candidatus Saccharibacteria bacterium]|nr:DEAD/DEAH box helicase family protein [Candidatus Saccharibacteria bacterium]